MFLLRWSTERKLTITLLAFFLISFEAQASIINTAGNVNVIAAPPSAELGVLESDTLITAFDEAQGYTLLSDLSLDIGGTLSTGTQVDSHFFFADAEDNLTNSVIGPGTITFDGLILGIIYLSASLDATDALLGSASTAYPTGLSFRGAGGFGLDPMLSPNSDVFSFLGNTLTIEQFGTLAGNIDSIRVVTVSPVPLPAAFWLFGSALLGFLGLSRGKKRS